MQSENYLQYKSSKINYIKFGVGEKLLFVFHGFNESGKSFLVLQPSLEKYYTVIAMDLPYHGKTIWNETTCFNTADLIEILQLFLSKYPFLRFSLLGFSMGGKCVLYITKSFAERIDVIYLLASDGIKTNKIYNVAVYPLWGKKLFKTTIKNPKWLFFIINILYKIKILSPWLKKFTEVHMETLEKRERLYNTWISMATFNPDIQLVMEKINTNQIHTILFFGNRDEVIPVSVGHFFKEGLFDAKLIILERGHYFIDEKFAPLLLAEMGLYFTNMKQ